MGLGLRTVGRAAVPVDYEIERELTADDLASLGEARESTPAPTVTRLRERHHALARCLASGMKNVEAAAVTGYDQSRISVLRADPAFRELIEHYRTHVDAAWRDGAQAMADLHLDATTILHERLVEDPDKFDNTELTEIMKLTADRTGHGPQTKSTNVNVNVDLGSRLEAARERAARAKQIEAVEAEIVE
jgi:hypothetical protein